MCGGFRFYDWWKISLKYRIVAQGAANIVSSLFGGIPATGAIARTATNVKNGGRTPKKNDRSLGWRRGYRMGWIRWGVPFFLL